MGNPRKAHTTANPEEALRIIREAFADPQLYPNNRDLLLKVFPYCGKTFNQLDALELGTLGDVLRGYRVNIVSYAFVKRMLAANMFEFPTENITDPQTGAQTTVVRKDIRDAFYGAFGYCEAIPENVLPRIEKVFEQEAHGAYAKAIDFVEALMLAEGKIGTRHTATINKSALLEELGLSSNPALESLTYEFLCRFVERPNSPYTPQQIQKIFVRAGHKRYWTPEELARNASAEIAAMQSEDPPPPFYIAVQRLLPGAYADFGQLAQWMKATLPEGQDFSTPMTTKRARYLVGGDNVFPEAEKNAMLAVLEQQTGITLEDQAFLSGLENNRRITGSVKFGEQLLAMLKDHCYVENSRTADKKFNITGSCARFSELTRPAPNAPPQLTAAGIYDIIKRPSKNVFQTMRAITLGFDNIKVQYEKDKDFDRADRIESELNLLISYTPYKREAFFLDANETVAFFIREAPQTWPANASTTRIGSLLNDVRCAWNFDVGMPDLYGLIPENAKVNFSLSSFQAFLTTIKTIPIKNGHGDTPPATDQPDKLQWIIEGIQAGLKKYRQPLLTEDSIKAIRQVALQSYEEFYALPLETRRQMASPKKQHATRS